MAIDQRLVWGGIAVGGAGIAIYMYRKNKKNEAATAAASQQTGYGYGMPTYAYGYGQTYSPYGYGFGPFGLGAYGGQGDYGYGYYGAGSGVPVGVPQQATTNAQWSEAAVSALTAVGYDGQSVLAALGIYLTGGGLTQDQSGIISAAIAAEGYPPVSGPNGFPPQMNVGGGGGTGQGSGGTTGGGTSGGGGVTGGGVGGTGGGGGGTRTTGGRITGLTGTATRNSISATWSRTNAPDGYDVIVRDLSRHDEVAHQTVNAPHFTARGLKPKTDYNIGVQALPGGPGANIHVRTK